MTLVILFDTVQCFPRDPSCMRTIRSSVSWRKDLSAMSEASWQGLMRHTAPRLRMVRTTEQNRRLWTVRARCSMAYERHLHLRISIPTTSRRSMVCRSLQSDRIHPPSNRPRMCSHLPRPAKVFEERREKALDIFRTVENPPVRECETLNFALKEGALVQGCLDFGKQAFVLRRWSLQAVQIPLRIRLPLRAYINPVINDQLGSRWRRTLCCLVSVVLSFNVTDDADSLGCYGQCEQR